jgi:tRNA pseudouridine38-40 synthase
MQTFKIIVAYDGTDFFGWQIQPRHVTVVSCLQKAFSNVFDRQISLIGASRTDTGVHALGQIARFKTDINLDEQRILRAWNGKLPKSVFIRGLQRVADSFHPCSNVAQKTYYYHLFLKPPLPFVARYGWFYNFISFVDFQKFNKALQLYIGEHDFASFCKVLPEEDKTTIRSINSIKLNMVPRFGVLQIEIKGRAFLRFQIRRMIGYALDVARSPHLPIDYLKDMLDNPNPQQTLLKADGCGLCLRKVVYKDEFNVKK